MSKAFTTTIRMHRKRSALSQDDVAFLIAAFSGTTASRHELHARTPSFIDALAYEVLFDVPASELFPNEFEKARARTALRAEGLLRMLEREGSTAETRHKRAFLEALLRRLRI